MKVRMHIFNFKVVARAAIVLFLSAASVYLLAIPLKNHLDNLYRTTGESVWYNAFYAVSDNRALFAVAACLLMLLFFSGWILRPAFNSFGQYIKENIHLEEEVTAPVKLPKDLEELEDGLNGVNKEIRLWKYAVKEAEQRKDDLVVYLAHDIRTPLTSVLGYLELLAETPDMLPSQRQKYTGVALRKARRMQLLVEELFEVTRYSISQIELERQAVNAGVLLNQLVEELEPLMREKGVQVHTRAKGALTLHVDADKMARALDNILRNAVYYTNTGGSIYIEYGSAADERHYIKVANTGTSISQDKLNRFFEKFYRGDAARQSGTGGSGLGLAIAKNIIEAHGGSITAKNENQITTFTVVL